MGIPKQVADMDALAEANLEADAGNVNADAANAASPQTNDQNAVPQETQQKDAADAAKPTAGVLDIAGAADGAAAQNGDLDALKLENQRMRSMMGRLGHEQREREAVQKTNEEMKARLAEREAEIENLRRELEEARTATSNANSGSKFSKTTMDALRAKLGDGYSDEELENFAAAVSEIAGAGTKDIREKIAAREKADVQRRVDDFKARLEADFPGFVKMDAEGDPSWVNFLNSHLPGVMSDVTYGNIAAVAARNLDYRKFAEVIRAFQAATKATFSPGSRAIDPAIAAQMRPQTVAARGGGETAEMPNTYPRSEIQAFYRAYQARRAETTYGITPEQVQERIRLYEDAEADGRVDETR